MTSPVHRFIVRETVVRVYEVSQAVHGAATPVEAREVLDAGAATCVIENWQPPNTEVLEGKAVNVTPTRSVTCLDCETLDVEVDENGRLEEHTATMDIMGVPMDRDEGSWDCTRGGDLYADVVRDHVEAAQRVRARAKREGDR